MKSCRLIEKNIEHVVLAFSSILFRKGHYPTLRYLTSGHDFTHWTQSPEYIDGSARRFAQAWNNNEIYFAPSNVIGIYFCNSSS